MRYNTIEYACNKGSTLPATFLSYMYEEKTFDRLVKQIITPVWYRPTTLIQLPITTHDHLS